MGVNDRLIEQAVKRATTSQLANSPQDYSKQWYIPRQLADEDGNPSLGEDGRPVVRQVPVEAVILDTLAQISGMVARLVEVLAPYPWSPGDTPEPDVEPDEAGEQDDVVQLELPLDLYDNTEFDT